MSGPDPLSASAHRPAAATPQVGPARTWPADWADRRSGEGCRVCAAGRPERTKGGVRFFAGRAADAYLRTSAPLPGSSSVIWRGRHVPDPAQFTPAESSAFFGDVAAVGRALNAVFSPAQINYLILGNAVPHVHAYLLPRYLDDPAPGMPLVDAVEHPVDPAEFADQLARLRAAVAVDPYAVEGDPDAGVTP